MHSRVTESKELYFRKLVYTRHIAASFHVMQIVAVECLLIACRSWLEQNISEEPVGLSRPNFTYDAPNGAPPSASWYSKLFLVLLRTKTAHSQSQRIGRKKVGHKHKRIRRDTHCGRWGNHFSLLVEVPTKNSYQMDKGKQCTYNVTLWRVRLIFIPPGLS
jgi:hypothetical protein